MGSSLSLTDILAALLGPLACWGDGVSGSGSQGDSTGLQARCARNVAVAGSRTALAALPCLSALRHVW